MNGPRPVPKLEYAVKMQYTALRGQPMHLSNSAVM